MQFQPGKSGNPTGRPRGSGHRQLVFNELVMPHQAALFEKAISLALAGNEHMLRLFLERMLPPRPQGTSINLELPDEITDDRATVVMGKMVLRGIASQDITPAQGKTILELAQEQLKLVEIAREVEEL